MSPGRMSRLIAGGNDDRRMAPSGKLVGLWDAHVPLAARKWRIGPWPPLWKRSW
jgi:hypothetical protein